MDLLPSSLFGIYVPFNQIPTFVVSPIVAQNCIPFRLPNISNQQCFTEVKQLQFLGTHNSPTLKNTYVISDFQDRVGIVVYF